METFDLPQRYEYCIGYKVIPNRQSRPRTGHSKATALVHITDNILINLHTGHASALSFFYLLILKCSIPWTVDYFWKHGNTTGLLIYPKMFSYSFLSNRTKTVINGHHSHFGHIRSTTWLCSRTNTVCFVYCKHI